MGYLKKHALTAASLAGAVIMLTAASNVSYGAPDKNVTIVNSPDNPALVRDIDNPALQPYGRLVDVENRYNSPATINIPDGLVIEFISADCYTTQDVPMHLLRVTGIVDHFLYPVKVGVHNAPGDVMVITHPTRIYTNSSTLALQVFPTTSPPPENPATTTCTVSISGHIVGP